MAKTKQSILVFDHSKLHKIQRAYVAEISEFDLCISNQKLPDPFGDVPQKFELK